MELFKKRETIVQNIAYMAIMAAVNIVFVLLCNLLPVLLFLLVFVLPLTSTIVTIYCKKKLYPIYAITTLGLCFAVAGGFSIFDAIIYVFPSLVVGFIFGYCIEKNVPAILVIVGATIIQFCLTYLTFVILGKIITNYNVLDGILVSIGLENHPLKVAFTLISTFVIAEIQIILSYLFIKFEIGKIGISLNLECNNILPLYITTFITITLAIASYFYFPNWTLTFVIMPLIIYVYETIQLLLKRKTYLYILIGALHIAFIFIFAFLYTYVSAPNQLILLVVLTGATTIIDFLTNYCFIKISK